MTFSNTLQPHARAYNGFMHGEQLPHLETFAKAAELSCFTAASRALGLTQAAVSQRVHALEKTLRVSLFQRGGSRVVLTKAGQKLYPYARRILTLHEEARQAITGEKPRISGELSLAASSIPGEHLLPALLSDFRRKYPHIKIRVAVADTSAVLRQVEGGQTHLGLVGGKDDSTNLEFRSFACDKMVLVVPKGHSWQRRKRISLKQLFGKPLILRETGSGSRRCLEVALERVGKSIKDLQVTMELGSNEGIKEAVMCGVGLAFLSTHAIRSELASGRLHALRVTGLPLERELFVTWDRRRVLPIPAQLFLHFLEACP